ncbi:tetratricopeptide repeat protein 16 [Stylonychia lemnae]|uniref:Tetratricopeptide repeat protein 16 n=1 Tax=Stylonychia lemnae TaxID=5949 RepID=A0A078A5M1_STYLE|nr:tetratricopeptide repeat protein 16 [Stylonychia lemnae]|eukprot:CDW77540.1 tetratricopeptide repeat protein 16 [Stylonychia lemnae]
MERLHRANDYIEVNNYEGALVEFSKIIFYDKNIPEVYAERAEIYIKLCDFSSAISNFKKAISLKHVQEWEVKLNQLFFMKGLTLIEEGYCNDALNLVSQLNSDDIQFIYLKALAYIRAGNKQLAFQEIEKCLERDPYNVEVMILKGKLLWSIDKIEEGNEMFWSAHAVDPDHHEIVEFLSIMKPRAEEFYKKATKFVFEGNKVLAFENIKKGLEMFHDMSKLLLLRASLFRQQRDYEQALNDLEKASKFMFAEKLEIEVKTQIGLTYNDMGSSLFQKHKYHDAVTIFNEALNFMPTDSGIYINRGDAYRELKKFNLALSDYHYALDLGGEERLIKARLSLTHYALGAQCFNQKDYEGANIEFSRVRSIRVNYLGH